MSCRGVSTRVRSPSAATVVTATGHWTPRQAWSASTTGWTRQGVPWSRRACASRGTRAVGAVTVWTSACTTIGCAGVGHPTSLRQRRWAGLQCARPGERLACRSTNACRRRVAACRSRRVSARARRRARRAASSMAGTDPGGRSPARSSRAHGRASRRSVVPRSPGCVGLTAGATTQPTSPWCVRERERQEPQGPAS